MAASRINICDDIMKEKELSQSLDQYDIFKHDHVTLEIHLTLSIPSQTHDQRGVSGWEETNWANML